MIKSIIFFWPSTDDQFDYLEGCPTIDHHIWSTRPSRYSGWPSIFFRVEKQHEAVKNELIQFFAFKNQTFYENRIIKLTERWQKVIEQNGQYIID